MVERDVAQAAGLEGEEGEALVEVPATAGAAAEAAAVGGSP